MCAKKNDEESSDSIDPTGPSGRSRVTTIAAIGIPVAAVLTIAGTQAGGPGELLEKLSLLLHLAYIPQQNPKTQGTHHIPRLSEP
eukprot:2028346-Pyramimonas_sp.AAC.2